MHTYIHTYIHICIHIYTYILCKSHRVWRLFDVFDLVLVRLTALNDNFFVSACRVPMKTDDKVAVRHGHDFTLVAASIGEAFTEHSQEKMCSWAALTIDQTLASLGHSAIYNIQNSVVSTSKGNKISQIVWMFAIERQTSDLSHDVSLWKSLQRITLPSAHWILQAQKANCFTGDSATFAWLSTHFQLL